MYRLQERRKRHRDRGIVRLYDRLWKVENPRDEMAAIREAKGCDALEAMKEMINPDSLTVLPHCYIEKYVADMPALSYLQFQRIGYFNIDKDSTPGHLVFNRTVGLKIPGERSINNFWARERVSELTTGDTPPPPSNRMIINCIIAN